MSQLSTEPILEPDLPIIDAHHHMWLQSEAALSALDAMDTIISRSIGPTYRRYARYLLDEFLADLQTGHNIRATVFCQCSAMYRVRGPERMRTVGEVEFINGVAAMAASGLFGGIQVCAGIVGGLDFKLGDGVEEVLHAQMQAGGDRYRGVRATGLLSDEDASILGPLNNAPHILKSEKFREGFKWLGRLGLSFDVLLLDPQLPDLVDLARDFPDTQIILNHVGVPLGVGRFAGKREGRFPIWRDNVRALAQCPNVVVKLGGLGIAAPGFKSFRADPPFTSEQLAAEWRPYVETCIEAFGARRCMFESNFPVDTATCTYPVLWNAFKRLAAGASKEEKAALFGGTAKRIYKLDVDLN